MSDVRSFTSDRADIAAAVIRRVGGDSKAVAAMLEEIQGDFSETLHRATVAVVPPTLGMVFGGTFAERVAVEGDLEGIRALTERATVVLAPTHASNLDSLVLGMTIGRAGFPPFAYAAGKHIFRNRVLGALMHRLGAYCLDPDRHDRTYMRVVNVYVHELLARGYHTVVFPSGTRCRSGAVESKIKLGLLGAAMHAPGPIAIVPVTINYQIILEAEHLIAYHLAGRSHERVVGDELFVWSRLHDTLRRLAALDQQVVIRIGEPLHVQGGAWRSELVASITGAYRRDSRYLPTHVVARALFEKTTIGEARDALRGQIWQGCEQLSDIEMATRALAAWASWHRVPPAEMRGGEFVVTNPDLLLFYRNRTAHIA